MNNSASGQEAGAGAGGGFVLSLAARNDIRENYDVGAAELESKLRTWLKAPTLKFVPNFEANFAKLKSFQPSDPDDPFRKDWESKIGTASYWYYHGFVSRMEGEGFKNDKMLQEGFKDVVEKNEISLKVLESLPGGKNNDIVVEEGVLCMRTTLEKWSINTETAAADLMSLL